MDDGVVVWVERENGDIEVLPPPVDVTWSTGFRELAWLDGDGPTLNHGDTLHLATGFIGDVIL